MVRLDLQYSRTWSPMLDLKILLDTPRAVLMGDGAY
jgi:lipopolysaccharide/colanic/teichoic acid biosynthesis glycosyltransferase